MFNDVVVATLFWRDCKQFRKGFVPYPHIKSVETFCQRYVKFLLVILKLPSARLMMMMPEPSAETSYLNCMQVVPGSLNRAGRSGFH